MRLKVSRSKNAASLYVTKTVYDGMKEKTITVEKLGTEKELREKLNGQDPYEWAKEYIKKLNEQEKEQTRSVLIPYSQAKQIQPNEHRSFNGGYLFLKKIFYELGLHNICSEISKKHKITYNLESILSRLIYSRILFPASKLSTYELSKKFIEQPSFELHQIYRALSLLSEETDYIQQQVYRNSLKMSKRRTGVIYYDCTNYFFEIEEADENGDRQYGISKEHRPNPIVQMGLFMDADGIPLAFCINPGNTNEQITLRPLEEKLISDFGMSKFIVCTDSGLASNENRKFNDRGGRAFITTQSLKKLKSHLKEWALNPSGWSLCGGCGKYDISQTDEEKDYDKTFYKERWINENGLEQKLIVTFSLKYKRYQEKIREGQTERAERAIKNGAAGVFKKNATDYRRFIRKDVCTKDGELAEKTIYTLNTERIDEEKQYDGFYGICTNLEDGAPEIIRINHRRWEIEECFRIMKSEFKARPTYLQRKDRIQAHFMICFLSLAVYRYVEKRLGESYTCEQIIDTLQEMNFYKTNGEGYIPMYTRTEITDALHESFGFRTDYEIISEKSMKKILKATQK